ncbi:hypothetical protein [Caulobacter sp. 17J65-9]|uniref:hypothetical protein n=1 Tax=Caulobacter sp. 17J65-9 TaxID=2709382 RepID=UPI0013C7E82D|nr:hypothetical protein [Caulobacter sp. 17J65-9]NEX94258.1 hypothetical protein [Caulobacter sp. 17J65-9]
MDVSKLHNNGVPPAFRGSALDQTAPVSGASSTETSGVRADFDKIAHKTPAERMRDALLKRLGYTEESLKDLSPEKREAVEQKLQQMLQEEAKTAAATGARPGQVKDVTA